MILADVLSCMCHVRVSLFDSTIRTKQYMLSRNLDELGAYYHAKASLKFLSSEVTDIKPTGYNHANIYIVRKL